MAQTTVVTVPAPPLEGVAVQDGAARIVSGAVAGRSPEVSLRVSSYAPAATDDGIAAEPVTAPPAEAVIAAGVVVSAMAVPPPLGTSDALTAAPAEKLAPVKPTVDPPRASEVPVWPLTEVIDAVGWLATVMLSDAVVVAVQVGAARIVSGAVAGRSPEVSLRVSSYAPAAADDGIAAEPVTAPPAEAVMVAGVVVSGMAVPPPLGTSDALTAAPPEKLAPVKLTVEPPRASEVPVWPLTEVIDAVGWLATVMLSDAVVVAVQVPLSVPRPLRTTVSVYVGTEIVVVPAALSVSDSVVLTAEGAAPAALAPPVPLKASEVVEPSPDTVAVPLIATLVIATGEVVELCGWSMLTCTVLPVAPESGVVRTMPPASVSGATPVMAQV